MSIWALSRTSQYRKGKKEQGTTRRERSASSVRLIDIAIIIIELIGCIGSRTDPLVSSSGKLRSPLTVELVYRRHGYQYRADPGEHPAFEPRAHGRVNVAFHWQIEQSSPDTRSNRTVTKGSERPSLLLVENCHFRFSDWRGSDAIDSRERKIRCNLKIQQRTSRSFPCSSSFTMKRNIVRELFIENQRCFIGPTASHILHCITSTAHDQTRTERNRMTNRPWCSIHWHWKVLFHHEWNTFAVPFDRQIETTQTIAAKRVGTALKDDACRTIELHHRGHDGFEH